MIGLKSGTVKIAPYDYEWQNCFKSEKELLKKEIGEFVLDIQHVGSTSIPGLEAKPIIDIAVGVTSLDVGIKCIEPLSRIGYEYKNEAGIPGRLFLLKGAKITERIICILKWLAVNYGITIFYSEIIFSNTMNLSMSILI